jgi:hypothetical protein
MVQERPVQVEGRLSAILAADVAGYSRLMHIHEEVTHAKLTALSAARVLASLWAQCSRPYRHNPTCFRVAHCESGPGLH